MTIPLWCLLAGCILPYAMAGWSVPYRNKQFGSLDLVQPRVQAEQLTGAGARVWGAQANAWEALIIFAIANFLATTRGVDPAGYWAVAAVIWLIARVLHPIFYVTGKAPLRVLMFVTGLGMAVWIAGLAITA